jgi:catechol 2,3-dioxygenase-like lactoylglutathione lyase family enzyme
MRRLLWPPEESEDHAAEIARFFGGDSIVSCPGGGAAAVLVVERDQGGLGGFVEAGLRPFAEGCETRPVGYVEGWFVDEDLRRRGVGRALLAAAEAWAIGEGCAEMASDCDPANEASRLAHLASGYVERGRAVQLAKRLTGAAPRALRIAQLALTVRDYDEAIAFYTGKLGFELVEDSNLGGGKRWVRVRPRGAIGATLLLARAVDARQGASVGNQTGGRVFLFLETDDLARDHRELAARGVTFVRPPDDQPWGKTAVFEDLYGNRFDLIEPKRG